MNSAIKQPIDLQDLQCPECRSIHLINDSSHGEMVCVTCGLVISEKAVDTRPEWRSFTREEENGRARTGRPFSNSVYDKGLSTVIDWRDCDAHGNKLNPEARAKIYRLRKWNTRTRLHASSDRNLRHAMAELDRLSSQLSISKSVKEAGALIYRRLLKEKITRGRSIDMIICACLYAACRSQKVPRTIDEFVRVSRGGRVELGRFYRFLIRAMNIKVPLVSPIDYVCRFGTELEIPQLIQGRAIELVKRATERGLTAGKDPTGLAAAVLYIACQVAGEERTQKVISGVSHVTEVTLRNRYKEIVQALKISMPV